MTTENELKRGNLNVSVFMHLIKLLWSFGIVRFTDKSLVTLKNDKD